MIHRVTLRNPETDANTVVHLKADEVDKPEHYRDSDGIDLETVDSVSLVEWLCENYKSFGATLEFVTNKSAEGSQFVRGFGGIGGLLRYKVDFVELNDAIDYEEELEDDNQELDFEDCFI